jgi:hypothetical protein
VTDVHSLSKHGLPEMLLFVKGATHSHTQTRTSSFKSHMCASPGTLKVTSIMDDMEHIVCSMLDAYRYN